MKIKLEDVIFWILIMSIIAVALWLLSGSPPETNALITISLFVATSEILLWKELFNIDKKTAVGFEKTSSQFKIVNQKNPFVLPHVKNHWFLSTIKNISF